MGSGCSQNNPSKYCLNPVSSNCTIYEGESVPVLGICTGDTITEVEKVIIDKILEILVGTGITLPQVTLANCPYLNILFANKDKTLANLIQLLVDSDCNLKTLIDQINQKLNGTGNNFVFDLKCLTAPTSPVTTDKIVQTIIDAHCLLTERVTKLEDGNTDNEIITQIVNNLLGDLITGPTGVKKTVTNGVVKYELLAMVPIGTVVVYDGDRSEFDSQGKGLVGTEVENWHICNGNGGTKDYRGVALVGAVQGIGGNTLSANVDPMANNDASMNYSVGSRGGVAKVSLTANQNGPHNHVLNDPGHDHGYDQPVKYTNSDKGGIPDYVNVQAGRTSKSVTGITLSPSGVGEKHENRMPYEAVIWIKRIK